MRRHGLQLSVPHRTTLYAVCVLLFVSGVAWAWIHRLDYLGEAGDALREWKPWLLKIHGYAAVGFVLLLGTLLSGHVRRGWRAHKNRINGALFLSSMGVLALTGYMLYYVGGEALRNAASQIHLWLGIASPVLLIWHVWAGRRATNGR